MLKDYPGSLDVLIKVSPHFQKLQNKLLRKALAGRVTVEQAASIAGVDLNILLSELNNLHENQTKENVQKFESVENKKNPEDEKPAYLKSLNSNDITLFDVRPILEAGKDPLKEILHEVKKLRKGKALSIVNSFEPIPLYELLGNKGFSHWSEYKDDCWKVYFFNEKDELLQVEGRQEIHKSIDRGNFENVIELDVHDLTPPEPMIKILENLDRIDDKSVMVVYHHREPLLLYPKLDERGYEAACNKINDEKYQVLIIKKRSVILQKSHRFHRTPLE